MSISALRNEANVLRQTISEVGTGTYYTAMLRALDTIDHAINDLEQFFLPVLVLLPEVYDQTQYSIIAKALAVPINDIRHGNVLHVGQCSLYFHQMNLPLPVVLGRLQAPLSLAWISDPMELAKPELKPQLRYIRLLRVVISSQETYTPVGLPENIFTLTQASREAEEGETQKWLHAFREGPGGQVLLEQALLGVVDQIAQLNRDNIVQETRLIGLRKALQTQLGQVLKLEEVGFNAFDLTGQIRTRIQTDFLDLEKQIKQKWEDANKPQTGAFFNLSLQLTNELNELEDSESFEKSEKMLLRPSSDFENNLQNQVHATLSIYFEEDAMLIQRQFTKLRTELNKLLVPQQIQELEQVPNVQNRFAFKKIADSYATIIKSYQGEMTKRGFTEYFVAIREYTTLISTVIGLLMPIIIGIGGFELIDEFVLKKREQQSTQVDSPLKIRPEAHGSPNSKSRWESMSFSQQLRTSVYTLSGLISILMLIYGFYTLSYRIPLMREEVYQRELRKARDSLMSESRRMFSDAAREWLSQVSNLCREQSNVFQNAVEKHLKEFLQQREKKLTDNRNTAQRRSHGIDLLQRKLSAVDRNKDQILQNIAQIRRNLDQRIEQYLKTLSS